MKNKPDFEDVIIYPGDEGKYLDELKESVSKEPLVCEVGDDVFIVDKKLSNNE